MPSAAIASALREGVQEWMRTFADTRITIRNPSVKINQRDENWYVLDEQYFESAPILARVSNAARGLPTTYGSRLPGTRVGDGSIVFIVSGDTNVSQESFVVWEGKPRMVLEIAISGVDGDNPSFKKIKVQL